MPPRAVTFLLMGQLLVVFFGVLFTGVFMRLHDSAMPYWPEPVVPDLVRHDGFWLELLPLAWATWVTLRVRRLDAVPEVGRAGVIVGWVLLAALFVFLAMTTIGAMASVTGVRGPVMVQ